MTRTQTWWFCYQCQTYHTADCPSWFSRSTAYVVDSPRVQYYIEEWKIEFWSTGVSRITARRQRSD